MQSRFDRQTRFAGLGPAGQQRLGRARVLLVGCGALGGALAQSFARSGVGTLVLCDRDVVEPSNLPRQVLFDERHALEREPKVVAARETLQRIGGPTRIETHAVHVDASNLAALAEGADVIVDGTDNLATRYLINDWAVRQGVPWAYGGVVGSGGLALGIVPGSGPCLRCLFPEAPPPGTLATCDTAGVLQPAVAAIAALQAGWVLRILGAERGGEPGTAAAPGPPEARLLEIDVWDARVRQLSVARDPDCPCCGARQFPFLEASSEGPAVKLCGRNAVQVHGRGARPDVDRLCAGLEGRVDDLRRAGDLVRFAVDGLRLTVFPDGRALVEGTEDPGRARAAYDRFLGG